jgi:hypothetical protein
MTFICGAVSSVRMAFLYSFNNIFVNKKGNDFLMVDCDSRRV